MIFAEAASAAESGESDRVDASFPEVVLHTDEPKPTENAQGQLSTITTDSTTYTFSYDLFGNATATSIGSNTLATYTYNEKNGKLIAITYGNGLVVDYVYNDLEQLIEVGYTSSSVRTVVYSYEYTSSGQVNRFTDHTIGKNTLYRYDTNGRLVSIVEYDEGALPAYQEFKTTLSYNDKGQLGLQTHYLNNPDEDALKTWSFSYSYTYNSDGSIKKRTLSTSTANGQETFGYDDYDRLIGKQFVGYLTSNTSTKFTNQILYTYSNYNDRTSGQVKTYQSKTNKYSALTYTYTYDMDGNITRIVYSTGKEIRYFYDNLGQLVREDNGFYNRTFVYTYDNAGNITSRITYALTAASATPSNPISTDTYAYDSTYAWGDLLLSYNDYPCQYDALGNLRSYYNGKGYGLTWTGRQLTGATTGGKTYTFTYNDEGIRTSKTKNGVTTTYYLNGSQIVAEETNGNVAVYLYDAAGSPIGMQYHGASYATDAWDVYWYEKNLQGDIVAIYNVSGTKLVSYAYDAWGNCREQRHVSALPNEVIFNPFRYRGYYYDFDLELYYLQSRYYDPAIGRFISADGVISDVGGDIRGYNLYAYCMNNPVNMSDSTGNWPSWATKLVVAAAIVAAVAAAAAVTVATAGTGTAIAAIAVGAAKGAAIGFGTGLITGGATGYMTTGTLEGTLNGMADGALSGAITGAITGGIKGGMSYSPKTTASPVSSNTTNTPNIKYPGNDPTKCNIPGFEWRGSGTPASGQGNFVNMKTGEWLHSDLNHGPPIGPHWDYGVRGISQTFRIFPDGSILPK